MEPCVTVNCKLTNCTLSMFFYVFSSSIVFVNVLVVIFMIFEFD